MAVTFAYTEPDGIKVYENGKPIYQAKGQGDLIDLLGTLFYGMASNQLISINRVKLENMRHQARLIQLVGQALTDRHKI